MMYLRTVWVFINLILSTLIIGTMVLGLSLISSKQQWLTAVIRFWARWNIFAAGMRIHVTGIENIDFNRQYVILGNHESSLDIFVVLAKVPLPMRIVSKIELRKLPLVGIAMARSLFPFVDRKNNKAAIITLEDTFKLLEQNNLSIFVYPEGTRSKTGRLIPFKKGGFILAINHHWPVLPVLLCGAGKINPPGTMWVKDVEISMHFLPPVETTDLTINDKENLRDQIFTTMSKVQEARRN